MDDSDELNTLQSTVEQTVFDRSLDVKKHLLSRSAATIATSTCTTTHAPTPEARGMKLPKIEVPTFDGNLLHVGTPFGNNLMLPSIANQAYRMQKSWFIFNKL